MGVSKRQMRHVAVLIETSRSYGRGLLEGVIRFSHEVGNWLLAFEPRRTEDPPKWLADWRGDGILSRASTPAMARLIQRCQIPTVHLHPASAAQPLVAGDNQSIAEQAFFHLKEKGLKHFGYCGLPPDYNPHLVDRGERFRQLVEASGSDCFMFAGDLCTELLIADWSGEQKDIIRWLRTLPKPVGVFACLEERAFQLLEACRQAKFRVPEEIAVIGAGNDALLCNMSIPSLTCIDTDAPRTGYEAARILDRIMNGEQPPSEPLLIPALGVIPRRSTEMLAVDDPDVAAALRYMKEHVTKGLQVSEILQHVPVSQPVLERKFKAILGRTPKAELVRLQIARARELLTDSSLPVKVVAIRCGFNSERYFSDAFRKATGLRPAAFRKQHRR